MEWLFTTIYFVMSVLDFVIFSAFMMMLLEIITLRKSSKEKQSLIETVKSTLNFFIAIMAITMMAKYLSS